MKKVMSILAAVWLFCCCTVTVYGAEDKLPAEKYKSLAGTSINVYNWGEYISDGSDGSMDVNKAFEALTGIKVNYTTYETNENMYNKLKGGGASYDIVIPSDYMIERLINEDMLEKINFENIPNYAYIDSQYKNLYYDPDNAYSVPYNVGMVGIIYNTKMVDETPASWDIMWNEKYADKILQFYNPRDAFATAQFLLGIDINTEDGQLWSKAYDKLAQQKGLVQSYVADEIFNKMESGEAAIGAYYAGDYLIMADNNPDLAFVYPKEGTNIFVDAICIPKGAGNKAAAELYINFLLSPEVALENAEYLCYASPNTTVLENEEYSLRDEEILYPSKENMPKTAYFHNLNQDTLTLMTTLWDNLKIDGNENTGIYIGLSITAALGITAFIVQKVKKHRREKLY